jgi:hypothetical protein
MNETSGEIWLRTDEIEEFIGGLEHSANLSVSIGNDVMNWKWLILALHNTLQGACTCALRGNDTAGVSMLTKKSAEAVWHWLDVESRRDASAPMPPEMLAPLLDLYGRVRKSRWLPEPHRLPAHQQMNKDVKKLNYLRNKFSHFLTQGFSLEVSGMPRIVRHCCDAIEHLAVKQPTFWHHLNESQTARIKSALGTLRTGMDSWEKQYAHCNQHEMPCKK